MEFENPLLLLLLIPGVAFLVFAARKNYAHLGEAQRLAAIAVRLLVVLKLSAYTIRHFVRPKSVERIKIDNVALPASVISDVVSVLFIWLIGLVVGALLASLDPALNIVSAFAASTAMICSTGPSFTIVDPGSVSAVIEGGASTTLAGTA